MFVSGKKIAPEAGLIDPHAFIFIIEKTPMQNLETD